MQTPSVPRAGGAYAALADRAYAFLRQARGRAPEGELAAALFGATAKGPLWARLLGDVLGGDRRFLRSADGAWSLADLSPLLTPLAEAEFVVVDIETTGLKPWRHRVLEVAALRLVGGRVVDAYAVLVNPGRRLPGYLRDLMGLAESDLEEAPPFAAIAGDLVAFLGSAVLVGHGLGLDLAYLQHELRLLGRPPLANRVLDTLDLAGRLLPGHGKPTLVNLASRLGLPVGRRHRAPSDARLVAALFAHLLDLARGEGARTLADLLPAAQLGEEGGSRHALLDSSALAAVPSGPGVYLLRDAAGRLVYVGKAVNLRERLETYFCRPPDYTRRMEGLLEAVADFETVPLGSELEALLLEAHFLSAQRPLFNVQRQAGLPPTFIRVGLGEEYPRLSVCAEPAADGARYYGPLRNGRAAQSALTQLSALFSLRTCRRVLGQAGKRKRSRSPCLKLRRGTCLGPCAGFTLGEEYRALAEELVRFLDGDRAATLARLQTQLEEASGARDLPRIDVLQRQLRAARLFALPPRVGRRPATAGLAVVQPSLETGEVEVFVVYRGRYGGQLRLHPPETDVAALAAHLRSVATAASACEDASAANIVVRWLAGQERPPLVSLPEGDEGWEQAAERVLDLAAAVLCPSPAAEGTAD